MDKLYGVLRDTVLYSVRSTVLRGYNVQCRKYFGNSLQSVEPYFRDTLHSVGIIYFENNTVDTT